jgi:hypothetical protein
VGQHRRIAALALALAAAAVAGCKGDVRGAPAPAPQVTATSSAAAPVDQLLPGELAPGEEKAFGLPIPRRMRIEARFPDAVFAAGELSPNDVAAYVRPRVIAEGVEKGTAKTVFTRATVKDAPERVLRIEIVARAGSTALVVRDVTRPPAKDGLSEEQRWKELGLTPQGEPLDRTKLE